MTAHHLLAALAALVLTLPAAAPAQGFVPPAGGLTDLTGPRALALGGGTGLVAANDGLFTNPAATAARKRYSMETLFAVDRRGGADAGRYLGASVVDSLSSPVAASFAWVHPLEGYQGGNLFIGGLAGSVGERLYLGAQGRYLALREDQADGTTRRVSVVTADAGLFWEAADYVSVGVAGFNLIPTGHEQTAPRALAAGLALGSDTSVKVIADWRADFDRVRDAAGKARTTNRYGAGVEAFLGNMVPLRAGWMRDETLDTSWWSAGAGLVTAGGVALDVGYRQSLEDSAVRIIAVSFKAQFLEL
ncbi:MAG: hypothetical protein NDI82_09675 [Anaeromyxobacteraceae bacterium]|nr:hypothetical protein [Anaeromyxobacteraceae bacterium]